MKLSATAASIAVVLALSVPAGAVTVKNTSSGEFTIGVDLGNED